MLKTKVFQLCLILITIIFFVSCGSEDENNPTSSTRIFYMGFTPWPYAATTEAVNNVYSFINTEGDIVGHHIQDGLPYTASDTLDFNTYDAGIKSEINGRISSTASNKVIYLAIDSLNGDRNDIAPLWADSGTIDLSTTGFGDALFYETYINFSLALIEKFKNDYGKEPEYFNYGTEVSDLMINDSTKFTEFVTFAQAIYATLKTQYPSMKLMVSIALKTPGSSEMITAKNGFAQIKDYVDVVGISTYGYAFYSHTDKGNPDNLPSDWLTQVKTIAPNKPYAITETGWIAEDLTIAAYFLNETSNEAYQNIFVNKLFNECNDNISSQFIIWFTAYDYDTLWTDTLASDDLSKIWKDTGLVDESLVERDALTTWRSWKTRIKE